MRLAMDYEILWWFVDEEMKRMIDHHCHAAAASGALQQYSLSQRFGTSASHEMGLLEYCYYPIEELLMMTMMMITMMSLPDVKPTVNALNHLQLRWHLMDDLLVWLLMYHGRTKWMMQ
jgi:hypothetical protein